MVAEVFLVRSQLTRQPAVMKVLRPELLSDSGVVGRFLDEAKVCETLDHPNVVKHLGVSRLPDGGFYILTRQLEGVDLARQLQDSGPLTPDQWLKLALPLCDALGYIHEKGIVHRDLKPSNIFLEGGLEAARPVLIDFGLARFEGHRVKTQAGAVLGTPEYVAPELVAGGTPDARSDLYALGVVMFESLVGHPPFSDPNPTQLLRMHQEDQPGPLPTSAALLEPVLQRCLAKKPEERFQTAGELKAALVDAQKELVSMMRSAGGHTLVAPEGATAEETSVSPGERLGSYRVERLLGEGGMGHVFLATHERLGRRVAIKVLRPELTGRRDTVDRFFQEARSVNQINHEHIVEVHDFVEEARPGGSRVYCILELLAGRTLRAALEAGPMTVARVVHIGVQLCDALGAAHRVGIVHRDVKPENVFLLERSGIQDFVKVLDFGMAKFHAPPGTPQATSTLQGMIIGTPQYMAPEQANGSATDVRTDLYALGVVLYEMLRGNVPFVSPSLMQLLVQIGTQTPPPVGDRAASGERIPEPLARVVMKCLQKSPDQRPQSTAEVLEVLTQIGAPPARVSPSPAVRPAEAPAPAESRADSVELALATTAKARRTRMIAGGVAAVALLVVAAAVAVRASAPADAPKMTLAPLPELPKPVAPAPAPPTPAPPPAPPSRVRLDVASSPPGATVKRLDSGALLGRTPLHETIAAGGSVVLRAELAGYRPVERTVRLDSDVTIDVPLSPEHASGTPKAKPPNKSRNDKDDLVDPLSP